MLQRKQCGARLAAVSKQLETLFESRVRSTTICSSRCLRSRRYCNEAQRESLSRKGQMIKIGFVIVSQPLTVRLLKLGRQLSLLFDNPPIDCHHEFPRCPLDKELFPPNVRLEWELSLLRLYEN